MQRIERAMTALRPDTLGLLVSSPASRKNKGSHRLAGPFALLPLLDELRTYCYEHQIEEIPVLLTV
jgi:hypothetical protein